MFIIELIENDCYKIIQNFQKLSDFSFPECVSFRFKCCVKYCLKNIELSLFKSSIDRLNEGVTHV